MIDHPAPSPSLHTFTSGVILPLVQSAITGVVIAIPAGMLAYLLGARSPWAWAGITWATVQAGAWLYMLVTWLDLIRPLETFTGLDIDGDGQIGEPAETVRIQLTEPDGKRITISDLPTSEIKLTILAHGLTAGRPLTEREWTGAGRPFSIGEFRALRDELINRGLAEWRNADPRQGLDLTKPGRAMVRYFSGQPSPNSPDQPA